MATAVCLFFLSFLPSNQPTIKTHLTNWCTINNQLLYCSKQQERRRSMPPNHWHWFETWWEQQCLPSAISETCFPKSTYPEFLLVFNFFVCVLNLKLHSLHSLHIHTPIHTSTKQPKDASLTSPSPVSKSSHSWLTMTNRERWSNGWRRVCSMPSTDDTYVHHDVCHFLTTLNRESSTACSECTNETKRDPWIYN